MKLPRRKFLHLAAGAAGLPAVSWFARAQDYPSRPVRIVVPFTAGGAVDTLARLYAEKFKDMRGITVPVVINVYSDRSFDFVLKSPPAAVLLKQAAGIPLGKKAGGEVLPAEEKAKNTGKYKGFKVNAKQVREIAEKKFKDLNARDVEHAARIVEGTARSMGLTVEG